MSEWMKEWRNEWNASGRFSYGDQVMGDIKQMALLFTHETPI